MYSLIVIWRERAEGEYDFWLCQRQQSRDFLIQNFKLCESFYRDNNFCVKWITNWIRCLKQTLKAARYKLDSHIVSSSNDFQMTDLLRPYLIHLDPLKAKKEFPVGGGWVGANQKYGKAQVKFWPFWPGPDLDLTWTWTWTWARQKSLSTFMYYVIQYHQ